VSLARVACIIPARDVADRIQATVAAASAVPGVEVVVVVDDGSSDPTGDYAGASGAIVVTHQRGRGRAAAIESGVNALGVLEQRDKRPECGTVLVLDADLGATAARAAHLIGPVVTERADLTIAVPPAAALDGQEPGFDLVETTAARGLTELADFTSRSPLATNRCLTRRAYELASPLAAGDGADLGMTIDLLRAGLRVREVEVDLAGPDAATGLAAQLDRALVLKDVTRALTARGLVRHGLDGLKESGGVRGLIDKLRG
jgi:glycosyltransferase involved in cell wall biosynthesis